MSRTIDEKVVEMRFDNRQFESNVKTSMSTLDKLKQSLKLTDAAKGFERVNSAAKGFDISSLSNGVETVRAKFSAMEVVAVTALANITNSAMNAGKKIISALTIDPIKSGFQEYETQINAVQTILANTKSKGTTLDDVNKALDTLNTYADKTIYNFTEMTRNIGTFTAAGIDLDTSVTAIQGIANLAAVSGSTSQQASTAMYQLSQALASGTVKLMDWNSVVNAGMGGQVFQDALKETARVHGINIDAMIKKQGSFRETLQKGWLTSEILTETLQKFTLTTEGLTEAEIAKNREMLKGKGYTDEQIDAIFELGKTSTDAATKVKTFSQLWDTLKEAAQSGWTQTWEIIVGDFEEAKELLTNISNVVGEMIGKSAEARNELLQKWKNVGGRTMLIEGFKNAFEGIANLVKPVKEAFTDIFPPITLQTLVDITRGFKKLTASFKEFASSNADKIKSIFKGIFSILEIGRKILVSFAQSVAKLLGSEGVSNLGTFILDTAAKIGDFFTSLNESFSTNGLEGLLSTVVSGISKLLTGAVDNLRNFGDIFSSIGNVISNVASKIWEALKGVFGWIKDNVSANGILKTINAIFGVLTGKKIYQSASGVQEFIQGFIDKFGNKEKVKGIKETITDLFDSIHDSILSLTSGVKVASLVGIAIAIGILAGSMEKISRLNAPEIGKALVAIGISMTILCQGLKSVMKSLKSFESKGVVKASLAVILMAEAVKILADAIEKIGKLSLKEIAKGLIGVGGGLAELCAGLKFLDGVKVSLRTSISMIALAKACEMLGDALQKFGQMQWDEIARGLTAMGGALGELVGALAVLSKIGGGGSILGSVGILIAVQSLEKMADGLKKFGEMNWDEIKRGLVGMGGALGELALALGGLGKLAGFSSIFASGSILIAVQGLDDLANAFKKFGEMAWGEIGRGLTAMGGALGEIAGISGALGKLAGFSSIFGAGSILITIQGLDDLANALKKFGEMPWEEIGRGLTAMGGALLEAGGISGGLGVLAGLAGIIGGASLWVTIQGLGNLADALKKFGEMSWDEIARGLTAMGSALGETALGGVLNTLSGFGAAAITEMSTSLGDLADSVKKWTGVTVPEGLSSQLSGLASGILSFTFTGAGANAISTVAADLGVLADSVKKWVGITVPEGLGDQLSTLASAINSFMLGGWGAGALATAAPAVGQMADSVKKWQGVTVPEGIEGKLTSIANGVKAFSWAFMGGWSMSSLVEPLGALPESLKKWSGVNVPEGIEEKLRSIANGVKSFSWAFTDAWTIGALVEPLAALTDSVKKWNGIKISEDLEDQLTQLANGIKAFSWAFLGAWSLDTVVGPLGELASSVKKWNGVTVPEDLGDQLSTLAAGVKSFSGITDVSTAVIAMTSISTSVKNLSGANFASICTGLNSLIDSAKNLGSIGPSIQSAGAQISSAVSGMMTAFSAAVNTYSPQIKMAFGNVINGIIAEITSRLASFTSVGITVMQSFLQGLSSGGTGANIYISGMMATILSYITSMQPMFYTAGYNTMSSLNSGMVAGSTIVYSGVTNSITMVLSSISSKQPAFFSAGLALTMRINQAIISGGSIINVTINSLMARVIALITSKQAMFHQIGILLMAMFNSGLTISGSVVPSTITSIVDMAKSALDGYYQSFYNAGAYLGDGLVDGINSKKQAAYDAGYALGQAAVQGEKDGQQSNSPSKLTIKAGKWIGEGLVIGMDKMAKSVYSSGKSMGQTAVDSISGALTYVADVANGGYDITPTIRPVVDMSSVRPERINLGANLDVSMIRPINSLSQIVSDAQSEINASNQKVIDAVNGLREDIVTLYNAVDGKETALYVDSKKLASSLSRSMNRELNILSKRGSY